MNKTKPIYVEVEVHTEFINYCKKNGYKANYLATRIVKEFLKNEVKNVK